MKIRDIRSDPVLEAIMETSSAGSTSAGSIASVPMGMGAVIKRMPTEPNLFGYVPKKRRKKKK